MGYAAIAMDTVGHRPLKTFEDESDVVREKIPGGGPSGVNVNTGVKQNGNHISAEIVSELPIIKV